MKDESERRCGPMFRIAVHFQPSSFTLHRRTGLLNSTPPVPSGHRVVTVFTRV